MSDEPRLRRFFGFSRTERYGICALCVLIAGLLAAQLLLSRRETALPDPGWAEFAAALDSLKSATAENPEPQPEATFDRTVRTYFRFDPNTATDAEWKQLGLAERQIRSIRNYQAAGGVFRKKTDFKKLYTIPAPLYNDLEPYIVIAAAADRAVRKRAARYPRTVRDNLPLIELNSADSATLERLPGIGPVLAKRIMNYRTRIGGFADVAQLGEVRGLDSSLVARLTPSVTVDTSLIQKININKAPFKTLVSNPYLSETQTRGILQYRRLQHSIRTFRELVRNHIITPEDTLKLRPYLSFEP